MGLGPRNSPVEALDKDVAAAERQRVEIGSIARAKFRFRLTDGGDPNLRCSSIRSARWGPRSEREAGRDGPVSRHPSRSACFGQQREP